MALVFTPRAALQLALPPPFTVRDFAPGVALVVVAVASCQSISVAGKAVGPGSFSDVGVMIESPDGSGGDHLYQLWQISDQEDLVRLMSTVGMATERAEISFEKTPTSATASARSTLSGQYDLTVFTAPPENGTGSGSNTWWHAGPHGVVRVRNAGDKVAFNPGNFVLNLATGSPLARMLGTTTLTGLGAIVYHGEHRGQLSVEQL